MFYNPMWSRLGDESAGPPGTYFYDGGSGTEKYFWHTFDQVLLRPGLLQAYETGHLEILTGIGTFPLDGGPSDHSPVLLRLPEIGT